MAGLVIPEEGDDGGLSGIGVAAAASSSLSRSFTRSASMAWEVTESTLAAVAESTQEVSSPPPPPSVTNAVAAAGEHVEDPVASFLNSHGLGKYIGAFRK